MGRGTEPREALPLGLGEQVVDRGAAGANLARVHRVERLADRADDVAGELARPQAPGPRVVLACEVGPEDVDG